MSKNDPQSKTERARTLMAQQRRSEQRRRLLIVGGIVLGLAVIVGVLFLVQSKRDTTGQTATTVPSGLSGAYTVTLGDSNAPTTITEYEDLQCPVCRAYEQAVGAKVAQAVADGKVKLELHMVAFLDQNSTTNYSSRALNAAVVVLDTSGKASSRSTTTCSTPTSPRRVRRASPTSS